VSSATTVKPAPVRDLGPPRNEARWACDCQLARAATPSPGALVTLLPLGLLALRRRGRENRPPRRR
jgi:MYXO-CTERM domain-containing protein